MFTRNIRTQVLLGKSGVKWDVPSETQRALESLNRDNNIADLLKRAENTRDEAIRFQTVDGDPIKAGHALERFADILKKVNTKNASDRNAVIASIDALIAAAPDGSALKTKATELKTSFEKSYEGAAAKETGWASTAKADTKKEMSRTMESVIQKNSRETQARDFTEYVASKLFDPIKSNFLDAVIKKDEMGKVTYELTNVSIPNLLRSIYEGTPYVADGAEFNDRYALKKFMEVYNNKESVFNTVLIPLAVAARAGQSVESVRKSGTLTASANNSAVIQYLTQVDNFETQGITALDRQLSAATVFAFNKVKGDDDKFLKVLQNALILGGSTESFSDLPTLKTALTTKPELKYAILAGIREAARSPGGIESLHDTKTASGIGENERKMLETLDTNKIKLLDGLKKGFTSQLEEQIKDGTIPALKKEEAQKSIDAYIADMKRDGSVGWNIVSKNLGAAITNRGAGAGAGATMDFPPNWLADNVSMGIGFSTGKPGVGVGITFDRAITQDTKLLYGWAGSPFVGMTTNQFERWHFTGIAGVGGGLFNVSRDMGNKDIEVRRMENLRSAEKTLSQIDEFAKGTNKKAKDVTFVHDVSGYPKESTDPMELTQERATKIHEAINRDIQNRLMLAGFDTETNPVIRSQMIYNALTQAIQSRIDLLQLDDATGGWSLKSLGLSLGQFAGVPFILPSISFGRTSYTQSLKIQETKKVGRKEIVKDTLFGEPVFSDDRESYSLPFAKNTPLTAENIDISRTPPAVFVSGLNGQGSHIEGLKDKGIKVTLKDGKYVFEYSTKLVASQKAISQETKFDSLEKVDSLKSALANKNTRMALSHLWNNPFRKVVVNDFVNKMQAFQKGEGTIKDVKENFINCIEGLKDLKPLAQSVSGLTDERQIQSALFDIRGAMMTDERQARNVSFDGLAHVVSVNESLDATKKRFARMVSSEKMSKLLSQMGLTVDDYKDIIKGSGKGKSKITIGDAKLNMVGAIASLKTAEPNMALMPAGTMRFVKNEDGEFMKDASGFDAEKKGKMFDVALPEGSVSEKALRIHIAEVFDKKATTPITSAELKSLMVNGKATIGGKEVTMKDQKFYLCAYGDCTNPGIAIAPGTISVEGKGDVPISIESIAVSSSGEYNAWMGSGAETSGLMGAIGYIAPGQSQVTPKPTSEPGESPVSPPSPVPGPSPVSPPSPGPGPGPNHPVVPHPLSVPGENKVTSIPAPAQSPVAAPAPAPVPVAPVPPPGTPSPHTK